MFQMLFSCAALAVFGPIWRTGETASTAETLIPLTVQSAPAPKPALRYLLLPELRELNPGNPIQSYLKCLTEQHKFFFDKQAFGRRQQLLAMPLEELPAQELTEESHVALGMLDSAARLDNPDWQILLRAKSDGIGLLLPDVQGMRTLARALRVRFRAEVANCRFSDALRSAKTMFAMSRHLGEHPTLIGDLVGIAIASLAVSTLDDMLQQPGCPNLYWALSNLPTPFIPLDRGMDGERLCVLSELRNLDESAPMTADQLQRFIAPLEKGLADDLPVKEGGVRGWLDARTNDAAKLAAARHRLVDCGFDAQLVLRFPADQVILLDEKREYEVRRDDLMKFANLPAWQFDAVVPRNKPAEAPALFGALVPALANVCRAQARLDQRIALLRHVEALRLYAAEHNGTLPAKLSEISVPLPPDPFTGKPFRYELSGGTAHLRGCPPRGEEKNPVLNVHYAVTVEK
jgi:hypothetical protein